MGERNLRLAPNILFADDQIRGPCRRWHHEHSFLEQEGGTLVRDAVEYAVLGGSLVNRLLLAPDVRRIFGYRTEVLRKLLG